MKEEAMRLDENKLILPTKKNILYIFHQQIVLPSNAPKHKKEMKDIKEELKIQEFYEEGNNNQGKNGK